MIDDESGRQSNTLDTIQHRLRFLNDLVDGGNGAFAKERCVGDHWTTTDVDVLSNTIQDNGSALRDARQLLTLVRIILEHLQGQIVTDFESFDFQSSSSQSDHFR